MFFLVLSVCGVRSKVLVIIRVYFHHSFMSYEITVSAATDASKVFTVARL